jgi:hypothetical protein
MEETGIAFKPTAEQRGWVEAMIGYGMPEAEIRLLIIRQPSPSGPARIPQCCQPNRSPTVLIPCALPGQTKSEFRGGKADANKLAFATIKPRWYPTWVGV